MSGGAEKGEPTRGVNRERAVIGRADDRTPVLTEPVWLTEAHVRLLHSAVLGLFGSRPVGSAVGSAVGRDGVQSMVRDGGVLQDVLGRPQERWRRHVAASRSSAPGVVVFARPLDETILRATQRRADSYGVASPPSPENPPELWPRRTPIDGTAASGRPSQEPVHQSVPVGPSMAQSEGPPVRSGHRVPPTEVSVFALAAAYGVGLVRERPFVQANERTALAAMRAFLFRNGYRFAPDPKEAVYMVNGAADVFDEESLAEWTQENAVSMHPAADACAR